MTLHDLVGTLGVSAIVGAYLMLQLGRLDSSSRAYSLVNAAGAALVLWSLLFDFNLSAFLVEAFWLIISLFGLARAMGGRRAGGGAVK